jgi:hypothetical protein
MATNCFSRGLQDPWLKLGLIRLARKHTRMDDETKKRIYKWATSLTQLKSVGRLTPELIGRLMQAPPVRWREILVVAGVLDEDADDPILEHLLLYEDHLDWSWLTAVLRGESIPDRRGPVSSRRLNEARNEFNDACQELYWQWLGKAEWKASLLILDEAHHTKNDGTRLASLFRSQDVSDCLETDNEARPLLWEKFDRMLFLTATPFQLGHHELIRVLRSFAGARWNRQTAPAASRQVFLSCLEQLEKKLDENRLVGRRLDRLWGRLTPTHIRATGGNPDALAQSVSLWWREVSNGTEDPFEQEIVRAVEECRRTKARAERGDGEAGDWTALRTWVVRHNRSSLLPREEGQADAPRRKACHGNAILAEEASESTGAGLSLAGDAALPFLLAARAQGELAATSGRGRAYFAEGLCSSYEAFHHTRENRGDARDVDDGEEATGTDRPSASDVGIVPLDWYEGQIERLIPSRAAPEGNRLRHPKVRAVVDRIVRLWQAGEKVLVFCFYRETVKSLSAHVRREIERATTALAARNLGLDPQRDMAEAGEWLGRITRRLGDRDSPFYREIVDVLRQPFRAPEFASLADHADTLIELLAAYVRSPSFVARYLPLEEAEVREALEARQTSATVIQAGVSALRRALTERRDASAMTMLRRVEEFLRFVRELLARSCHGADDGEGNHNFLQDYLEAVAVFVSPRRAEDDDEPDDREGEQGAYRVLHTVRRVLGETKPEVRQRLMLAFNSPLFPEVLISSSVLGEGVDLHRFCRHVIHHDLCWNPSTLEQRTGRLDRIRCKAEVVRRPILVFEPFLAGSADEKMFRVVRDRERWFQIVMGQKFEFDEAASEQLASRIPLPDELARELIFDLRRAVPTAPTLSANEAVCSEGPRS